MRYKLAVLSLVTGITFAGVAFADMSIPYGWYVGPNIGITKLTNKSFSGSTSTSGISGSVNLGYKFMPYFAGEVGYSRYANTTARSGGTNVASYRYTSYDLAGKGIVPLNTSGFEVFGKLGIVRVNANVSIQDAAAASAVGISGGSRNSTGIYLGVGGQYYFMPEMAVVLQWARASGSSQTGTLDLWTIGFSYLFS